MQQKPHQRGLALGMSPQPRSLSAAGVRTLHIRPPLQSLLKHVPLACSSPATCVEQKKQSKLNPQPLAHPAAASAWSAPHLHKPERDPTRGQQREFIPRSHLHSNQAAAALLHAFCPVCSLWVLSPGEEALPAPQTRAAPTLGGCCPLGKAPRGVRVPLD